MKTIYKAGNAYFSDIDEASKFGEAEQITVFEDVAEWYAEKGEILAGNILNSISEQQYIAIRMYFEKVFNK